VTFDDGSTISYAYDASDLLTQIVDSANGTITPTYNLLDGFTAEEMPQGTVD
jgi:YD repeat-containing protein